MDVECDEVVHQSDVAHIRSAKRVLMVLEHVNQAGPTTVSAIARAVELRRRHRPRSRRLTRGS